MALQDVGPVEYVVIALPTDGGEQAVAETVARLTDSEELNLLDLVFGRRGQDGSVDFVEYSQAREDWGLDGLDLELAALTSAEDLDAIGTALEVGQRVVVLVVEHRWLGELAGAAQAAGGSILLDEIVDPEALAAAVAAAGQD